MLHRQKAPSEFFGRGRCLGARAPLRPGASRVESKSGLGEELAPGCVFVSSRTPSTRPFNLLTPDACSAHWITQTRLAQVARRACCSGRRGRLLLPPPRHPSWHADAALIRFPHLLSTGGWLSVSGVGSPHTLTKKKKNLLFSSSPNWG